MFKKLGEKIQQSRREAEERRIEQERLEQQRIEQEKAKLLTLSDKQLLVELLFSVKTIENSFSGRLDKLEKTIRDLEYSINQINSNVDNIKSISENNNFTSY